MPVCLRRNFLKSIAGLPTLALTSSGQCAEANHLVSEATVVRQTAPRQKAQIAITLDLEIARHFPVLGETRWDYEKGNLNDETKEYAVKVKRNGGRIHFFVVGRVFEQENVDRLQEIAREGHPIGNHVRRKGASDPISKLTLCFGNKRFCGPPK